MRLHPSEGPPKVMYTHLLPNAQAPRLAPPPRPPSGPPVPSFIRAPGYRAPQSQATTEREVWGSGGCWFSGPTTVAQSGHPTHDGWPWEPRQRAGTGWEEGGEDTKQGNGGLDGSSGWSWESRFPGTALQGSGRGVAGGPQRRLASPTLRGGPGEGGGINFQLSAQTPPYSEGGSRRQALASFCFALLVQM